MNRRQLLKSIIGLLCTFPTIGSIKYNDNTPLISPETMKEIHNWGVDQLDEITRYEILTQKMYVKGH